MVRIWVHSNIAKLGGGQTDWSVEVNSPRSVGIILREIFTECPQLLFGLIDETGSLRKHINIYIEDTDIRRLNGLDSMVEKYARVSIFTAVSGG